MRVERLSKKQSPYINQHNVSTVQSEFIGLDIHANYNLSN